MNLIEVNLNQTLLLENFLFQDFNNNIDYLNQQAILSNDYEEQLSLLILATEKVEKFHSFFHFEQSYFHLQLAIHLRNENKITESDVQLEAAIFQDHVNEQAIGLLNNTNTSVKPYQRQYAKFIDYLYFATEENGDCVSKNSYWDDYLEYQIKAKSEILERIIRPLSKLITLSPNYV